MCEILEIYCDSSTTKAGIYCESLGWVMSLAYPKKLNVNQGEFTAISMALHSILAFSNRIKLPVFLYTDSQTLYNSILGVWHIKDPKLVVLLDDILQSIDQIIDCGIDLHICKIDRKHNTKADELTHE